MSCTAIIKQGARKGQECGAKAKGNGYCARHASFEPAKEPVKEPLTGHSEIAGIGEKYKPFKMLRMKDDSDKYHIDMGQFPGLPFRWAIVGKSQISGKTNAVGNILLLMYDDQFPGRNIYVVCPSIHRDEKWKNLVNIKEIPEGNIYTKYDEGELTALYNKIDHDYNEAKRDGRDPEHKLLVLDDCAFSGVLKERMYGVIQDIASQGRHRLLSLIVTAQKYSTIDTTLRENVTACMFYRCTPKQLEQIMDDHCFIERKEFLRIFKEATKVKHTFLMINYNNSEKDMYMTHEFLPIPHT